VRAESWDRLHRDFEDNVFDPVGSDLRGVFWRAVWKHGRNARRVADFGCGTGRQLPRLARRFDRVVGIDFAHRLLEVARERIAGADNVDLRCADLRRGQRNLCDFDLGVCVNAWIMPRADERRAMLRTLRRCLRPGAALILVVPSLEAALFVNERLIEWNRRSGLRGRQIFREGIATTPAAARDLLQGVIDLDGSRTSHFLREQAHCALAEAGFRLLEEARVEYPWDAYFHRPPAWLGEAHPWDWLFVARREEGS